MEPLQLACLAHRPHFPHDLHILLVDADYKARLEVEAQLHDQHYRVTPCSCAEEAATHIASTDNAVDIILADVRCLQQQSTENTAILRASKSIPLVLMSEKGAPGEVMLGIKLGAVDFLEKPLSPMKLKNIWQHLVRNLMASASSEGGDKKKTSKSIASASPADSGSSGSRCESGSNASTSDLHPELPSHHDGLDTVDTQLIGILEMSSHAHLADVLMHEADGPLTGTCARSRPQPQRYRAGRAPGQSHSGSGGVSGPQPCMGQPAGRLPPLPEGVPGVAWGLPTTPLQFCPKAPLGGMPPGPMGWPPMFPFMPSPAPSDSSALYQRSHSCMGLTGGGGSELSLPGLAMRRAESAPLPALSHLSGPGEGLMLPLSAPASQRSSLDRSCLFSGLEGREDGAAAAPIGLTLKKSDSLLDFLSEMLKYADDCPAS